MEFLDFSDSRADIGKQGGLDRTQILRCTSAAPPQTIWNQMKRWDCPVCKHPVIGGKGVVDVKANIFFSSRPTGSIDKQ